mmetsp:Transcript_203/g.652  ORF Transcript_203/g.652 Transcript_203/m.652 type:complete len:532 (+) Transcript_203:162-1757(+)
MRQVLARPRPAPTTNDGLMRPASDGDERADCRGSGATPACDGRVRHGPQSRSAVGRCDHWCLWAAATRHVHPRTVLTSPPSTSTSTSHRPFLLAAPHARLRSRRRNGRAQRGAAPRRRPPHRCEVQLSRGRVRPDAGARRACAPLHAARTTPDREPTQARGRPGQTRAPPLPLPPFPSPNPRPGFQFLPPGVAGARSPLRATFAWRTEPAARTTPPSPLRPRSVVDVGAAHRHGARLAALVRDVVQRHALVPLRVVAEDLDRADAGEHLDHLALGRMAPRDQRVLRVLLPLVLRQLDRDGLALAVQSDVGAVREARQADERAAVARRALDHDQRRLAVDVARREVAGRRRHRERELAAVRHGVVAQELVGRHEVPPRVVVARHLVRVDLGVRRQHVVIQQPARVGLVHKATVRHARRARAVVHHRPVVQARGEVRGHHLARGRQQPDDALLRRRRRVAHRVGEHRPLALRRVRVRRRCVHNPVLGARHEHGRSRRRRRHARPALGVIAKVGEHLRQLIHRAAVRHARQPRR